MKTELRDMNGQQLLLLRVLGDVSAQAVAEYERDRRAMAKSLDRSWLRPAPATAVASLDPQLAA